VSTNTKKRILHSFSVEELARAQLYVDTHLTEMDSEFPNGTTSTTQWRALTKVQRQLYIRDAERVVRILGARGKR
jgi:hypothetical protein